MNKIEQINEMVKKLYSNKKYSELKALSRLFSNDFLKGLEVILNKDCKKSESFVERYKISCGWIDKIPLADFTNNVYDINENLIDSKVELGDLLLVYTHNQNGINQEEVKAQVLYNSAVIVQAKISNTKYSKVPLGKLNKHKVTPTSKELALLSNWPAFDLYKTSRSKEKILPNLNLIEKPTYAKFAGYFNKCWYVGEPLFDAKCNKTLGSLIMGIIERKEGEPFTPKSDNTDWDKLINAIINLCGEYKLPGYLFSENRKRYFTRSFLFSTPLILSFFFFFFVPNRKKFPVMVINRIFEEGKRS